MSEQNEILCYADGYRAMGRQGIVTVSVWSVITDLERNMAPILAASKQREAALQKSLTAADERNDNRDSEIFAQVRSALRRSFSLGQIYWQQADSDSTCQQNKSDQTMETQEQHILNVLKSVGAALKPAEHAKDEHVCTGCGSKGWTANCSECVPY